MEQINALNGQEVDPGNMHDGENQVQETASMQSLLDEQGLSLEFPTQGEIRQTQLPDHDGRA